MVKRVMFGLMCLSLHAQANALAFEKQVIVHRQGQIDLSKLHGYYQEDCVLSVKKNSPSFLEVMAGGSGQPDSVQLGAGVKLDLLPTAQSFVLKGQSLCSDDQNISYGHLVLSYDGKSRKFPLRISDNSSIEVTLAKIQAPSKEIIKKLLKTASVSNRPFNETACAQKIQDIDLELSSFSESFDGYRSNRSHLREYLKVGDGEDYQNSSMNFLIDLTNNVDAASEGVLISPGKPEDVRYTLRSGFYIDDVGTYISQQDDLTSVQVRNFAKIQLGSFTKTFYKTPLYCE